MAIHRGEGKFVRRVRCVKLAPAAASFLCLGVCEGEGETGQQTEQRQRKRVEKA